MDHELHGNTKAAKEAKAKAIEQKAQDGTAPVLLYTRPEPSYRLQARPLKKQKIVAEKGEDRRKRKFEHREDRDNDSGGEDLEQSQHARALQERGEAADEMLELWRENRENAAMAREDFAQTEPVVHDKLITKKKSGNGKPKQRLVRTKPKAHGKSKSSDDKGKVEAELNPQADAKQARNTSRC